MADPQPMDPNAPIPPPQPVKPRILFLADDDYEVLMKDGGAARLKGREEKGFFEKVLTFHPWAGQTRMMEITPGHHLYELQEIYPLPMRTFPMLRPLHHPAYWFNVVKETLRLIDAERINMIQAMDPVYAGLMAWWVGRKRRIPVCVFIHAQYDQRPGRARKGILAQAIERFVLRRADLVLAVRQTLVEKIIARGIPASHIRMVPHGIDLTPFETKPTGRIRRELGISPDNHILSFAGRLVRENYVYDILKLAMTLKETHANFSVVMAGDGPERWNMDRYIKDHDIGDKVRLVGFQPREFVAELRKESSISLCLRGGYSLIEACAAGRPVISYDVDWHSELVKTGVTGVLLPEKNVEGLAASVKELLYNPGEADWLGESAKVMAFQNHDYRNTSKLKHLYYQELLAIATLPK